MMGEIFWQKDDKQVDRKELSLLVEEKITKNNILYNNGLGWVIFYLSLGKNCLMITIFIH